MPEDMDVRILRGADDAIGHLRFVVAEALMDARHHDLEVRQHIIGKVEFAIRQDVHLAAGEQAKIAAFLREFFVDLFHRVELFAQTICVQAVRHEGRL